MVSRNAGFISFIITVMDNTKKKPTLFLINIFDSA